MKFVSAEEFLKQPIEVQRVFLNWWKCDTGDLFFKKVEYELHREYCNVLCINIDLESDIEGDWDYLKQESIPLFREGQLRKFIEDNGYVIELSTYDGYEIEISMPDKNNPGWLIKKCTINGDDLLDLYWKSALEIASKKVTI